MLSQLAFITFTSSFIVNSLFSKRFRIFILLHLIVHQAAMYFPFFDQATPSYLLLPIIASCSIEYSVLLYKYKIFTTLPLLGHQAAM